MKQYKYFRALLCILLMCMVSVVSAQSNGDKLYNEGLQLQKTMTIASQNAAIKKFQAAKIVYSAADKKQQCDTQIATCNKNIQTIKRKAADQAAAAERAKQAQAEEKAAEPEPEPVQDTHVNVELTLSKTRLDFKAEPKEGFSQVVKVKCNYDDWSFGDMPDWVKVYRADNEFSVRVENNDTGVDRSGIVKVQCGDKVVDLIINQSKLKGLKKAIKSVQKTFDI